MKNLNKTLVCAVTLALCAGSFVSCEKDSSGKSIIGGGSDGELVYTGTMNALDVKTEGAQIYYVKGDDLYYVYGFYSGSGSFDFKWDRETNKITMLESMTGLFYGENIICVLSQEDYLKYTDPSEVKDSYYDPESGTFYFNVMLETADYNQVVFQESYQFVFTISTDSPSTKFGESFI